MPRDVTMGCNPVEPSRFSLSWLNLRFNRRDYPVCKGYSVRESGQCEKGKRDVQWKRPVETSCEWKVETSSGNVPVGVEPDTD